jgi:hypothetical protein
MREFLKILGLGSLCVLVSCNETPKDVVYVVPDGYSGILKLRSKQSNGQETEWKDNRVTYMFSSNGVVDIKGTLPTKKWHALSARFKSGTILPVAGPGLDLPKDAIALRALGLTPDGLESWDVVGTEDDMVRANRDVLIKMHERASRLKSFE